MVNITADELEFFFKRIIESLRSHQIESVELDTDYYLHIPASDWEKFYEYYNRKIEPNVGSLIDDYESLKKDMKEFDGIPIPFVDYDRVASLLNAISQKINPPE